MVPRVGAALARTQRLNHALGDPAAPSTHTSVVSVVSSVTDPLAKLSGHGLSGNKPPSPQGAKGKETIEIDDNDLGHLSYGLELDNIEDDLPHSRLVLYTHDLALKSDQMQENLA